MTLPFISFFFFFGLGKGILVFPRHYCGGGAFQPSPLASLVLELLGRMSGTLEVIFKEEKVPAEISEVLCKSLTANSFACLAPSAEQLETVLRDALSPELHDMLTAVTLACLKASHHRCLTNVVSLAASRSAALPAQQTALPLSSGWTETFPAKLSFDKVSKMKEKFESDYPSELLDAACMPSSRLLAIVNKQCQEKHFTYIAWKHRISEEKLEDMQGQRPKKVARFEDYIFDEVPTRDIPESGISQMFLAHLLDLVAFAFCLLEAAHLAAFRAYNKLFLRLAFLRPAPESGLRVPNVHEMQIADKEAWKCICDLVNTGWSMDDALHEIVQVRCILHTYLQPRPAVVKPKPPPRIPFVQQHQEAKGGKGKKGKGKGTGKLKDGPKWCTDFFENGVKKQICKKWNLRSGCKLDDCAFVHGCCVDVNGRPCGKDHPAYMHKAS